MLFSQLGQQLQVCMPCTVIKHIVIQDFLQSHIRCLTELLYNHFNFDGREQYFSWRGLQPNHIRVSFFAFRTSPPPPQKKREITGHGASPRSHDVVSDAHKHRECGMFATGCIYRGANHFLGVFDAAIPVHWRRGKHRCCAQSVQVSTCLTVDNNRGGRRSVFGAGVCACTFALSPYQARHTIKWHCTSQHHLFVPTHLSPCS